MPLDNLEKQALQPELRPEQIAGAENREGALTPEKSASEAGGYREQAQPATEIRPVDQPLPQPAYSQANDPAYQAYKQIETILEEDLGEMYNNLTPQEQKNFKIKGEETTRGIFNLVYHQTKVKVKKIIKLIKDWLKLLPGINKFFLEQEAKIKTDRIIATVKDDKKVQF
jgi:hypothetical protein